MSNSDLKASRRLQIEVSTRRKGDQETSYFWNQVQRNMNSGQKPRRDGRHDEAILFKANVTQDETMMDVYNAIPVERSGPGENVPVLISFNDLKSNIGFPDFLSDNISRMRYENPTPIQKHAIPLGLANLDLMCCSQTVTYIFGDFSFVTQRY